MLPAPLVLDEVQTMSKTCRIAFAAIALTLSGYFATAPLAPSRTLAIEPNEQPAQAVVQVRIWQDVNDPFWLAVVARAENGRWQEVALLDEGRSASGRYYTLEVATTVPLPGARATVEARVWQDVSDPHRIFLAARQEGGDWRDFGTVRLSLDDGLSVGGRYRYGDAAVTVVPVGSPLPPKLIIVSDGSPDSLALEWTAALPGATGWEYRQREPAGGDWSSWTAVPGSDGATRRYEMTGMTPDDSYYFQVRPIIGTVPGEPSDSTPGHTYPQDGHRWIGRYNVVEGDGRTEWDLGDFTITIPQGARLRGAPVGCGPETDCWFYFTLYHLPSGSSLSFSLTGIYDYDEGLYLYENIFEDGRSIVPSTEEDVHALFDTLVESVNPLQPMLAVISGGMRNSLLLEWSVDDRYATGWQYRLRPWGSGEQGDWTDIPGSTGATRSHRLADLEPGDYAVQVRTVRGQSRGWTPSRESRGIAYYALDWPDYPPELESHLIYEGDGRNEWYLGEDLCITIPDGLRLAINWTWLNPGSAVLLWDAVSWSHLAIGDDGAEIARAVVATPRPGHAHPHSRQTLDEGVDAHFDELLASVRRCYRYFL